MKVLVTGATGFTGAHVVRRLLESGMTVTCFARPSSDLSVLPAGRVRIARGNLDRPASLESALRGMDVLVNIASLGFGHAPVIAAAAVQASVRRALFISSTAIFTTLPAGSKAVRLVAEQVIRDSGISFTILRPTMIYGSVRDRNMCRLIRFLARSPIVPVVGRRDAHQQPVYVDDVATAVVQVLESEKTSQRAYNIAGADAVTLEEMIDTVCGLLGRRVWKVRLPEWPIRAALTGAERVGLRLAVRSEQLKRLSEDKRVDIGDAVRDFAYAPRTFKEGISLELQEIGLL